MPPTPLQVVVVPLLSQGDLTRRLRPQTDRWLLSQWASTNRVPSPQARSDTEHAPTAREAAIQL